MPLEPDEVSRRRLRALLRQSPLAVSLGLILVALLLLRSARGKTDWGLTLGSTFLATGLISVLWQVLVDRWQVERLADTVRGILQETGIAYGLVETRLGDVKAPDFQAMMGKAVDISAVCLYDSRWRENWCPDVDRFLGRGGRFRLCVPDPDDLPLMAALASRHDMAGAPHKFQSDVRQLLEFFTKRAIDHPGRIEVRTCSAPGPSYTAYLFAGPDSDGAAITRMYDHVMAQGKSLTEQTVREGGTLFRHYAKDYEDLWVKAAPYPHTEAEAEAVPARPAHVGVIGPSDASGPLYELARDVGRLLAQRSAIVICGGLGGVMEAAARGASDVPGGRAVGVLPGLDPALGNAYLTERDATGLGDARNLSLVDRSDAVIAVGCSPGTLVEVAYAYASGKPVFSLSFWDVLDGGEPQLTTAVATASEAVSKALTAVGMPQPKVARSERAPARREPPTALPGP